MTEHTLKTLSKYWDAIECGDKTFEVRKNDRDFKMGDILVLQRLTDTGCLEIFKLRRRIIYILPGGQFGIEAGYVVLGLIDIDDHTMSVWT